MRKAIIGAAGIGILSGVVLSQQGNGSVNGDLPAAVAAAFAPHVFIDDSREGAPFTLPYRLMRPLDEATGERYPLVVFLHGFGERGEDNWRQLLNGGPEFSEDAFRRRHPAFFVAPQCPDGVVAGTDLDRAWVRRLEVGGPAMIDLSAPPEPQLGAVHALVERLCSSEPIDRDRVYMVGLSMGGYAVWEEATRYPELYAAAAPICGSGDPKLAARLVGMPLWAFHGAVDSVVPCERSVEMVRAIDAAGGRAILTLYPGVDHGSWVPMFQSIEAWDWLFAQRRDTSHGR